MCFLEKIHCYYPTLITSTTVTLTNLVSLVEEKSFREAMMLILLLNDIVPSYIV